mmetsp:Transcript_54274/g.150994  ORF Transcript_54274/g.150994 Transcript_54274/m.150994 type:complete len:200 (+) Transcript_54274:831-1430(+)
MLQEAVAADRHIPRGVRGDNRGRCRQLRCTTPLHASAVEVAFREAAGQMAVARPSRHRFPQLTEEAVRDLELHGCCHQILGGQSCVETEGPKFPHHCVEAQAQQRRPRFLQKSQAHAMDELHPSAKKIVPNAQHVRVGEAVAKERQEPLRRVKLGAQIKGVENSAQIRKVRFHKAIELESGQPQLREMVAKVLIHSMAK